MSDDDLQPRIRSAQPRARGADLFLAGWLPERAAAKALGCSVGVLVCRANAGLIKARNIGPAATLYEVGDWPLGRFVRGQR